MTFNEFYDSAKAIVEKHGFDAENEYFNVSVGKNTYSKKVDYNVTFGIKSAHTNLTSVKHQSLSFVLESFDAAMKLRVLASSKTEEMQEMEVENV